MKRGNRSGFRRLSASFGVIILVLNQGGGRSRGNTVLFWLVKAPFGVIMLILV